MPSKRVYWAPMRGRATLNFNWPGVLNLSSAVVVTASEYDPLQINISIPLPGGGPPPPPPRRDRRRFIGAANVTVSNISPHGPGGADPGGVTFVVNIDWDSPIPICTDITVLDRPDELIFAWGALVG